jgi:hypothetical protein
MQRRDVDRRLFREFAPRRLEHRLAELLHAAREAPAPRARRLRALHDKHAALAPDDAEHAHDRMVGIFALHRLRLLAPSCGPARMPRSSPRRSRASSLG